MTIKEVSLQCGLSQDTLRYYERIGILPPIKRSTGGYREYTENDCRWIEAIKWMRKAGMSIELLLQYVQLAHQGDTTSEVRRQLLLTQRTKLAAQIKKLKDTMLLLDKKIENYNEGVLQNTKNLVDGESIKNKGEM